MKFGRVFLNFEWTVGFVINKVVQISTQVTGVVEVLVYFESERHVGIINWLKDFYLYS